MSKEKLISRVKSNIFQDHSSYLKQRDAHDIRESTFFKKVSVTSIFSVILYILEMNALEKDPNERLTWLIVFFNN